jgi:hypothetical protein
MEILWVGKALTEELRAVNGAIGAYDKAAIGLLGKEYLTQSINDKRIKSATNQRQNDCANDSGTEFYEKGPHLLGKVKSGDNDID